MVDAATILGIVLLLGLLVGAAYLLERRAKARGDLISGDRHRAPERGSLRLYLGLLLLLASLALGTWAILSESWLLLAVAAVPFLLGIAARYYWYLRWLLSLIQRDGQDDRAG